MYKTIVSLQMTLRNVSTISMSTSPSVSIPMCVVPYLRNTSSSSHSYSVHGSYRMTIKLIWCVEYIFRVPGLCIYFNLLIFYMYLHMHNDTPVVFPI